MSRMSMGGVVWKPALAVFCLFWLLATGRALAEDIPMQVLAAAKAPGDTAAVAAPGTPPGESPSGTDNGQPAAPPPKVGELTEAKGQVKARRAQDPQRVLAEGSAVYAADALSTGAEDKGKVTFTDGSALEIGPESQVVVADFAYDLAQPDASRQAIHLAKGLFRYVSGKVVEQDPAHLRLESPLAVIGIRGTTMDHKIVTEIKTVKGVPTEVVKEELHALRATTHSQVVVDQQGLKSLLTKPDQAAFLRPKLPGSVRPLTEKEKQDFATIPLSPAPFDPRPGRGGLMGGGN